MDPGELMGGVSVAELLDGWFSAAYALVKHRCDGLVACGGDVGHCEQLGMDAVSQTCCGRTLDFYVQHKDEIEACATAQLQCDAGFDLVCPVLDATPFEALCGDAS